MTIQITLPPELEAELRRRAAEAGQDPSTYVRKSVECLLRNETPTVQPAVEGDLAPSPILSPQQKVEELRAWIASQPRRGVIADDSRESIYEGCGE